MKKSNPRFIQWLLTGIIYITKVNKKMKKLRRKNTLFLYFWMALFMLSSFKNPSFAIWSSFILFLLTAIAIIAYDLPFQRMNANGFSLDSAYATKVPQAGSNDALLAEAEQHIQEEKFSDAWKTLLIAEDEYRKHDRLELLSRVHWHRARLLQELKEFDGAQEEIDRSATLSERLGSVEYKTETAYLQALNYFGRKEYVSAYELLENWLEAPNTIPGKSALHFHNLAGLSREGAGDSYEAETHYLTALHISRQLNPRQYGFIYGNLGHVYAEHGRLNEAKKYLALDFDWSNRNHQYGSAASAAYQLAQLMGESELDNDKQAALHYLNAADSLYLCAETKDIKVPSDSIWWKIQTAGSQLTHPHTDIALVARRAALDRRLAVHRNNKKIRDSFYATGRAQWREHLHERNESAQRSGYAFSIAAGLWLLISIALLKPKYS